MGRTLEGGACGLAIESARRGAPRRLRASMSGTALVVTLLAIAPAHASDRDWTWHDTALEATYFAVQAVDWMQTRSFLARGSLETNPILGERPTRAELLAYNAVTLTLHAAVAYALPKPYREVWQVVSIGVESWQVGSNIRTSAALRLALP
jgi:hypothetical protein